jgi:hypothetical protein
MEIAVVGIDLGKNKCSVVGLDAAGKVITRRRRPLCEHALPRRENPGPQSLAGPGRLGAASVSNLRPIPLLNRKANHPSVATEEE